MSHKLNDLLGVNPLPWLLSAKEPYARWATRAVLLGQPNDPETIADRDAVLADQGVAELIAGLPGWGDGDFPGHHSPAFLPNRLNLLADMGVQANDATEIEILLDALLEHQDKSGRFLSFGRVPGRPKPEWGSLLCDTNAITDVLLRFGRADDLRVVLALKRIASDASGSTQGQGWRCVPEKSTLWRGPGKVADACPQVTLEGLRVWSQVPTTDRPRWLLQAARTPLEIWRRRVDERPYAFGHGYQFKSVKWPNFWYDVLWVLETLSRFPELWQGPDAREEDRIALAELAACLIAYNLDPKGRVTPRRTYRAFEQYSFGQKKEPSPFATARTLVPLARLSDLAEEIAVVDVEGLPSAKGGSGTSVPPKRPPRLCPTPTRVASFEIDRAVPRVLARHHIGTPHEPASIESVVADAVGLHATYPMTPYLALDARLEAFERARLDAALYEHRSLVRVRAMRGSLFVMRHDLLTAVIASTRRPIIKYAREFAVARGVDRATWERFAPLVVEALGDGALTSAQLRIALGEPDFDVAALVGYLSASSQIVRDRPAGDWRDRQWTYLPFSEALPDIKLDSMDESTGDPVVLRAYVRAYGPVTPRDAAWWTGIGPRRVDRALDALGDEIVDVRIEGNGDTLLMHAADVDELSSAALLESPSVAMLPALDPLTTGYARKDRFVGDALRPYVFDAAGNAAATILVDGQVAGVWDTRGHKEPGIMLFVPEMRGPKVRDAIQRAALELGHSIYGEEVPISPVSEMQPLAERTPGSVAHPLR